MRTRREELDALVTAAREAEGPTASDRARIRAALMAQVAPPPPPTTSTSPAATLSAPVVGGIGALVVAVGVGLLAPRRPPPARRPVAAAVVSSPPPAPPRPPPPARDLRTDRTPHPAPLPAPPPAVRRRPRAILAEPVPPLPAPPPPAPPPPEVLAPVPAPSPAPSLAPASGSGHTTPSDHNAALPPELLVLAEARALLRAGDARGALLRLERFAAEHPDAPRAAERSGATLIARCAEGIAGTGEVREYLARHGDSPLAAGVRDRCASLIPPR
ncbi:MAG: hypothetical protein R3A48_25465 [Polyangiales bacterium]